MEVNDAELSKSRGLRKVEMLRFMLVIVSAVLLEW